MKHKLSLLLLSALSVMPFAPAAMAQIQPSISVAKGNEALQATVKSSADSVWSEVEKLDLTAVQQEEIDAIKAGVSEQMAEILTPEQLQTFQAAQANGDDMRSTVMSLGINRSQRSAVMNVMRAAREDINAVLTPEQRAQIEEEASRYRD